ncbi:MAG TPA: hypothetical protein VLU73_04995 [Methylococcaceae bacterium]|jgi:hypothetical protein|nr:hypothetical protein [Methylococcaceae bacterium]
MTAEVKRYRELGALIRAAQAELGAGQISLIEAQERELGRIAAHPQITNLESQITAWKCEHERLFRYIDGKEETALMSSAESSGSLDGLKPETIGRRPLKGNGDSGCQLTIA